MENIKLQVIVEDNNICTITVSNDEYQKIIQDDNLLREAVIKQMKKTNIDTIPELCHDNTVNSTENLENLELNDIETERRNDDKQNIFIWPDKAVMLLLETYREKEPEFTNKQKRHNKLWRDITLKLNNFNYKVTGFQVQNKMSSLKRAYKKIKDSNAKSGNSYTSWEFYSIMESLFCKKAWVSPPATATSEGTTVSDMSASCSSQQSSSSSQNQESNKVKKRKVESILESFISDIKNDKEETLKKKDEEQLEREKKKDAEMRD